MSKKKGNSGSVKRVKGENSIVFQSPVTGVFEQHEYNIATRMQSISNDTNLKAEAWLKESFEKIQIEADVVLREYLGEHWEEYFRHFPEEYMLAGSVKKVKIVQPFLPVRYYIPKKPEWAVQLRGKLDRFHIARLLDAYKLKSECIHLLGILQALYHGTGKATASEREYSHCRLCVLSIELGRMAERIVMRQHEPKIIAHKNSKEGARKAAELHSRKAAKRRPDFKNLVVVAIKKLQKEKGHNRVYQMACENVGDETGYSARHVMNLVPNTWTPSKKRNMK
jgi:hypothetical protein